MPIETSEKVMNRVEMDCVSVVLIDGGSYRTQDNTALIKALKDSRTSKDLIFVFLINPVYKTRTHQKHFIYDIMKNMYLDFKEKDILLHCFCDDVVSVIKIITKQVKIKNLYMNRSINYPERLNVKKLQTISTSYDFKLNISDDVCVQKMDQRYDHSQDQEISFASYINDFVNKNSPNHECVPKPDCRELTELCAHYNDSINYNVSAFENEINFQHIVEKTYNISKEIWSSFNIINKRMGTNTTERFKVLNNKWSRQKAFKLLKSQKKQSESDNYYVLFSYIKHGILSSREIYHKIVDNCYEGCVLDLRNSKLMQHLVRRDYNFQTYREVRDVNKSDYNYIISQNLETKKMAHDMMFGITGIHIIDAGIRQMEIQGIIHPSVKKIVYSYARHIVKDPIIDERYFQKLIDYDYVLDHEIWESNPCVTVDYFNSMMYQYIKDHNLESYIDEWGK